MILYKAHSVLALWISKKSNLYMAKLVIPKSYCMIHTGILILYVYNEITPYYIPDLF